MSNPKQPNVFYMGVFDLAQNDGKSINEREVIRKILELNPNARYFGPKPSKELLGFPLKQMIFHRPKRGIVSDIRLQLWFMREVTKAIQSVDGPTVVITRAHYLSFAPIIIKKRTGVPMINKEAGIPNWFYAGHQRTPIGLRNLLVWLRKKNILSADRNWCVTEVIAEHWKKAGNLSDERVFVQPNGVNIDMFNAAAEPRFPSGVTKPRDINILYAGNLHHSGVPELVQALPGLAALGYDVGVIAAGDGEQREEIECLAREHCVEDRVTILGWLPYDTMPSLYARCDILAAVYDQEFLDTNGFRSQKIYQYLGAGRAVIAGRCPEHDFVEEYGFGWMTDPHDTDEMVKVIASIIDDPALMQRDSARSQWAEETASYDAVARNILKHVGDLSAAATPIAMKR
jgi:glycosyltransferase involved in cell wall biosynthesis